MVLKHDILTSPLPMTNLFASKCSHKGGMLYIYIWQGSNIEKKACDVKVCVPSTKYAQHPWKISYTYGWQNRPDSSGMSIWPTLFHGEDQGLSSHPLMCSPRPIPFFYGHKILHIIL